MEEEHLQSVVQLDDFLAGGAPHKQVEHGQVIDLVALVLEKVLEVVTFVFLLDALVLVFEFVDVV